MTLTPTLLATDEEIDSVVREALTSEQVALDIESNGMFAYRAGLCTTQLSWRTQQGDTRVALIDTLAVDPRRLAPLFQTTSPAKVIHDLSFDARLLAHEGIMLQGVRDTAVAAGYLGRTSTGLRALLLSELGVQLDKELQLSDWGRRPLDAQAIAYLGKDVEHLLELWEVLWAEVEEKDIADEVQSETEYRLRSALLPENQAPTFRRVKGWDRLDQGTLAVLRALAQRREELAERENVPPYQIARDDVLTYLAQRRPGSVAAIQALVSGKKLKEETARELITAIEVGIASGPVPASELPDAPRLDREAIELRKRREKRLSGWREKEAERRGLNPQVVLPGHCLRDLAGLSELDADSVRSIDGLGRSRADRYAEQIAELLRTIGAGA